MSSHPSGSGTIAIRVAGPPSSTCPLSPISSICPSDSASFAGQATPQLSPQIQPPSLSFTYDAQALSLSPPVIISPTITTPSLSSPAVSMSELVSRSSQPQGLLLSSPSSGPETPFSSFSLSSPDSVASSLESASPLMLNLAVPASPAYPLSSRTLSDVDRADFVSAASQTPSISEAEFLSAIGDDDFDVLSQSTRSTTSALGNEFDWGDDFSEAGSWTSVSQPRR